MTASCARDTYASYNEKLSAADLQLGEAENKVVAALGEGEQQPCVAGYERVYRDKDMTVGFHQEQHTVRRVTMKSADYTYDGISPGQAVAEGIAKAQQDGWKLEDGFKSQLLKENLRLTLTSIKGEIIDEVSIEIRP